MAIAAFVGMAGWASSASFAQLSGNLGAHDPSTLIKEGSTYYYFSTGQGITVHTSTDRVNWTLGPAVFNTPPAWTTTAVPGYTGSAWAPDIAYFNGLYHLYYSVSTWGTIDSAIGMATSPTLANAVWTDRGKIVQSDAAGSTQPQTDTTLYNAIDPSVMVDNATGRVWMSWGSYSSGVVITELDPVTGNRLNNSTLVATKVANNAAGGGWGSSIEGSALVKRGSFYYLFVNYGECCQGVDSTYNMRVGRSTSPTGPFVDKNGVDLRNGGGSMFLDDDGRMIGPGHFSFYTEGGQDQFGYHYYNGDANGAPTYNLHNLYWTADAWPSYAAVSPDWYGATSSGWSTATNWSGGVVPNGVGQIASFDANTAGRYTVSLDGAGRTLGSINFRNNGSYTIGAAAGPAITLDANADANQIATVNVAAGNHTIAAPITAVDALAVNVSTNSTLTLGAAVTAPSLTKYGRGALSLGGTNTYNGNLLARWGTIDITGSLATSGWTSIGTIANESATLTVRGTATYVAGSDVNVGDTGDAFSPATGILNLAENASLTVNSGGGLFVGSGYFANSKSVGTVNQSGGTLTANGNFDGAFIIGGRGSAAAVGTYNLSGGVVNANTNLRVGGYGTGTLNQTGGTFNANGYASVGRFNGSTGTWNLSGGTLNQTAANLIIGESGRGTLNASGTGSVVAANALRIGLNASGVGVVNLDGGTVTAPSLSRGSGSATLNFDGGTLRAGAAATTFLQGLTAANVQAGGATIDTQNFAVTVAQPLLHDATLGTTPDGGLTKLGSGTLTLAGTSTYSGATLVKAGTLSVSGTIGSAARNVSVGHQDGGTGNLAVPSTGTVSGDEVWFAEAGSPVGTATGTGSISTGGKLSSARWTVIGRSGNAGSNGTLNVNGGVLNIRTGGVEGNLEVAVFDAVSGTLNLTAGSVNLLNNAKLIVGSQNTSGNGTVNQTGGSVTFFADAGLNAGGSGTLTLGGGSSSGTYTYTLSGGTLTVPAINKSTSSSAAKGVFNFNGGTLKPTGDSAAFVAGLSAANIQGGGAKVDTNGFAVTIAQPLLGSAGDGGVTKSGPGTLSLQGANTYAGSTVVTAGTLRATPPAYTNFLTNAGGLDLQSTGRVQLDYTDSSPVATVRSLLQASYAATSGSFATGQIRSSAHGAGQTIGYGDNGTNSVTLRLTLAGDATLDGSVDFNDFLTLQNNFGKPNTRFDQGDFNYDGWTDFNDFLLLQNHFGQSIGAGVALLSAEQVAAVTAFSAALPVPEPLGVTVIGLAAVSACRRRSKGCRR